MSSENFKLDSTRVPTSMTTSSFSSRGGDLTGMVAPSGAFSQSVGDRTFHGNPSTNTTSLPQNSPPFSPMSTNAKPISSSVSQSQVISQPTLTTPSTVSQRAVAAALGNSQSPTQLPLTNRSYSSSYQVSIPQQNPSNNNSYSNSTVTLPIPNPQDPDTSRSSNTTGNIYRKPGFQTSPPLGPTSQSQNLRRGSVSALFANPFPNQSTTSYSSNTHSQTQSASQNFGYGYNNQTVTGMDLTLPNSSTSNPAGSRSHTSANYAYTSRPTVSALHSNECSPSPTTAVSKPNAHQLSSVLPSVNNSTQAKGSHVQDRKMAASSTPVSVAMHLERRGSLVAVQEHTQSGIRASGAYSNCGNQDAFDMDPRRRCLQNIQSRYRPVHLNIHSNDFDACGNGESAFDNNSDRDGVLRRYTLPAKITKNQTHDLSNLPPGVTGFDKLDNGSNRLVGQDRRTKKVMSVPPTIVGKFLNSSNFDNDALNYRMNRQCDTDANMRFGFRHDNIHTNIGLGFDSFQTAPMEAQRTFYGAFRSESRDFDNFGISTNINIDAGFEDDNFVDVFLNDEFNNMQNTLNLNDTNAPNGNLVGDRHNSSSFNEEKRGSSFSTQTLNSDNTYSYMIDKVDANVPVFTKDFNYHNVHTSREAEAGTRGTMCVNGYNGWNGQNSLGLITAPLNQKVQGISSVASMFQGENSLNLKRRGTLFMQNGENEGKTDGKYECPLPPAVAKKRVEPGLFKSSRTLNAERISDSEDLRKAVLLKRCSSDSKMINKRNIDNVHEGQNNASIGSNGVVNNSPLTQGHLPIMKRTRKSEPPMQAPVLDIKLEGENSNTNRDPFVKCETEKAMEENQSENEEENSLNAALSLKYNKDGTIRKIRSKQQTSKFRGVSKCSKDGRWQARIRIGSEVKYLGRFKNEIEAAICYDQAAYKFHGHKAVPNFRGAESIPSGTQLSPNAHSYLRLLTPVSSVSQHSLGIAQGLCSSSNNFDLHMHKHLQTQNSLPAETSERSWLTNDFF